MVGRSFSQVITLATDMSLHESMVRCCPVYHLELMYRVSMRVGVVQLIVYDPVIAVSRAEMPCVQLRSGGSGGWSSSSDEEMYSGSVWGSVVPPSSGKRPWMVSPSRMP